MRVRAFPNPFNPDVRITIIVPAAVDATAVVYDVAGRRVATVWEGRAAAGENRISWAGKDDAGRAVPSGVYFLRVRAGTEVRTTKLTILK
jgi:flagellar hook assembly protein FlgD